MTINYNPFIIELSKKFTDMPHLVTEDLIRQWFIETQTLTYKDTRIEKPYKCLSIKPKFKGVINNRAHADLYYQEDGIEDVVIEFKYHKKINTSPTCKTTNMGEVFRDLNRLACLENKEKYFIYVFDQEMKKYYDKKYKEYKTLEFLVYDKAKGEYQVGVNIDREKLPKNALDTAFSPFGGVFNEFADFDYDIQIEHASALKSNFYLLAFKVL